MPGNTIGKIFRLTTFGESHGNAIGGIVDGCPAGLTVDFDFIRNELQRRGPLYTGATRRSEPDIPDFLSGIKDGLTLGTPIAFQVPNRENDPGAYEDLREIYRPSHADYTYQAKYGVRDHRGGGRASGRETVARVVGGALAKILLRAVGVEVHAMLSGAGKLSFPYPPREEDLARAEASAFRWPDPGTEGEVAALVESSLEKGDTLGGSISCRISGVPAGLGEPVFDKLQADLARAVMSIGTARAFEFGLGMEAAKITGSEHNDGFRMEDRTVHTVTNIDGGIQGGISNGEPIYFRVGFKPVSSHHLPQKTINTSGEPVEITISGRHDTFHVPRLVVVVESMTALVLADHYLRDRASRL